MSTTLTLTHNPTTITAPAYGVVGPSGTAWKVVNLSSVSYSSDLATGILLNSGGAVINGGTGTKSASISGRPVRDRYVQGIGVWIRHAAGTVTNFGAITGGAGIELERGGTITNFGKVSGTGGLYAGIVLQFGGTVTNGAANAPSASITGVDISGAAGAVTNFGVITGIRASDKATTVTNYGKITNILLDAGGTVTNATPKALISGGVNISRGTTGTVTNFGTIENGVALYNGGVVTNGGAHNTSALISGYSGVHVASGGNATKLTNFGKITGVSLSGGTVTNGSAGTRRALIASKTDDGVFIGGTTAAVTNFGTISGRRGVALEPTGTSTVRNFGTILGHGNDSVFLLRGGTVTNEAGAVISGGSTGVDIEVGTVTNLGRIAAAYTGVESALGALVTNGGAGVASATIAGGRTGVIMYGNNATLRNSGTIIGAGGTAVELFSGNSRVIVEPGSKFLGAAGKPGAVFDNGRYATLELAPKSSGTLPLGTQFAGFSTVIVDSGADWRVDVGLASLAGETITGNGSSVLAFTNPGTLDLSAVRGFQTIRLADGEANSLTLSDANFAGIGNATISVYGGHADNAVDAASVTGKNRVFLVGNRDKDLFTGGAGNDVFSFSAGDLANTDILKGGAGNDQLRLTGAGAVRAHGASGVETYILFNGAGNVLSLANANFAEVAGSTITVDGGNAGNTLSEAGVAAVDKAVLNGGAGNDILIAGRNAVLKGGAGKDLFELTVAGSPTDLDRNTIADFRHGTDKIALSEKGFNLGAAPVAASLFTTGSFTNASQRFAYDTTNGDLFFDSRGNAGASPLEIATLTSHPTLTASDISFVA